MLDLIYADKAVDHILSGKAIARAVRAHLLVDAALNTLIASKAFNVGLLQRHYDVVSHGFMSISGKTITDDLPG